MEFTYKENDQIKHNLDFFNDYFIYRLFDDTTGVFQSKSIKRYEINKYLTEKGLKLKDFTGLEEYLKDDILVDLFTIVKCIESKNSNLIDWNKFNEIKIYLENNYDFPRYC